jgi:hypothetical protein
MAGEKKPRDTLLKVGTALCGFAVLLLLASLEPLTLKTLIRLECTRGKDCFLTKASWFSQEVTHFREPALKGAKVVESRHHRRGTPLGLYSPVVEVENNSSYSLWYGNTPTRQEAEADAARVAEWKASPDPAPLRMENDQRGAVARRVGEMVGGSLFLLALGVFLIRLHHRRNPRSTPRRGNRRKR